MQKLIVKTQSVLLLILTASLYARTNDNYAETSALLGIDKNAGTNSFQTLLIPSGGTFESMAGTHTAMALDHGVLESNPAGLSFLPYGILSISHVDWISDSSLETISYAFRAEKDENLGIGFNTKFFHVPFQGRDETGDIATYRGQSANGWYTELISTASFSYNFLRNFYFGGLSAGGSLKVGYRGLSNTIRTGQDAISLMGDLGIMTQFNFLKLYSARDMNFSVGLTLKNIGTEFIDSPDPLPSFASFGIGYKPIKFLNFAFDLNMPFNLNGSEPESPNFGVGIHASILPFLSAQTGVHIKKGKPRMAIGTEIILDNMTLQTNYTLDLVSQAEPFDRFSISIKINLDYVKEQINKNKVQELYIKGLEAYANDEIESAIKYWQQCLEINPNFTPASQMLETSKDVLALQQELLSSLRE